MIYIFFLCILVNIFEVIKYLYELFSKKEEVKKDRKNYFFSFLGNVHPEALM
jgi:hypothetical protein